MSKSWIALVAAFCLGLALPASADWDEFCAGFEEGYKAIMGDMVIVPICPIPPITPIGSTDYREGLKAGMAAAKRDRR